MFGQCGIIWANCISPGKQRSMGEWYSIPVCGLSLAGIAGPNPTEGMAVSCECCLLSGRGPWSRGTVPSVVCLSVIMKPRHSRGPGPLGVVTPWSGAVMKLKIK